jgi:CRP/FNR family cyclic AMP-dependent transcriptional regulator
VLAAVPLFEGLSKRHLRAIARCSRRVRYPALTRIVRKGDRGDAFYAILEGRARVTEVEVVLGPGDVFGELALLDGKPRSLTVEAETDVLALRIGRSEFLRVLKDEPSVSLKLLQELAGRTRQLQGLSPTH